MLNIKLTFVLAAAQIPLAGAATPTREPFRRVSLVSLRFSSPYSAESEDELCVLVLDHVAYFFY